MPDYNAFRIACVTLLMSNAGIEYGGLTLTQTESHYEIRESAGPNQYRILRHLPKSLDNAEEIVRELMELTGVYR